MPQPHAKVLDYAVGLDHEGGWVIDDGVERLGERWTAEHLVLAGLVRCSLTSLAYHARRIRIAVAASSGHAHAKITKRESDGRYAFVDVDVRLEVVLEPPCDDVAGLLARAERDCFISASLTAPPRYRWTVNGGEIASAA